MKQASVLVQEIKLSVCFHAQQIKYVRSDRRRIIVGKNVCYMKGGGGQRWLLNENICTEIKKKIIIKKK